LASKRKNGPRNSTPPAPMAVSEEVATGLEGIRSHGGRDDELYVAADTAFYPEPFMTESIVDPEEMVRFVKAVENLVRRSREYEAYVGFLHGGMGMNRCSFLSKIDMTSEEVGLEMHHCPLTLFDICQIVADHRLRRGYKITTMTVADEVLGAHAAGHVGLVPVSKAAHKLIHAGQLVVHPAMVVGDWLQFMRDYPDGVDTTHVEKTMRFSSVTEEQLAASMRVLHFDPSTIRTVEGAPRPTRAQLEALVAGARIAHSQSD